MRVIEWVLTTIQYRSFKAYGMIKNDQRRREKDSETPFEKTWFFKLQKLAWGINHYRKYKYKADQLADAYLTVLETLAVKSEVFKTESFELIGTKLRLSGSTLVINEVWAINRCANGIYVHKRFNEEAEWILVYRTYWLTRDASFMRLLVNVRDTCPVAVPARLDTAKDNTSNFASKALIC